MINMYLYEKYVFILINVMDTHSVYRDIHKILTWNRIGLWILHLAGCQNDLGNLKKYFYLGHYPCYWWGGLRWDLVCVVL